MPHLFSQFFFNTHQVPTKYSSSIMRKKIEPKKKKTSVALRRAMCTQRYWNKHPLNSALGGCLFQQSHARGPSFTSIFQGKLQHMSVATSINFEDSMLKTKHSWAFQNILYFPSQFLSCWIIFLEKLLTFLQIVYSLEDVRVLLCVHTCLQ